MQFTYPRRSIISLALALCWAVGVQAQDDFSEDVTVITSDKLTFDYQNQYAHFEGNVVVEDQRIRLTSDILTVRFDDNGDLNHIEAKGQVFIQQGEKNARSEMATYDVTSGEIVLEGDPQLQRGKNLLFADRIIFWRDSDKLEAYPHVRLILFPDDDNSSSNLLGRE